MHGGSERERPPFWEKPLVRVSTYYGRDEHKYPDVEAKDDNLLIYFRLCKAEYARSIAEAKELDAREVLQALNYEMFLSDYEQAFLEMNK